MVASERNYRIFNGIEGHYAGELMTRKQYQYQDSEEQAILAMLTPLTPF